MKVIKFYKDNCAPCVQVEEYLNKKEVEHQSINAFDMPSVASENKVKSLPTVLVYDDEWTEVYRSKGFKPEELDEIAKLVNKA